MAMADDSFLFPLPLDNLLFDDSDSTEVTSNSARHEQTLLGLDFVPEEWDVICGRGKISFDHVGNRRFRVVVAMNLTRYVESKTRADKSFVVNAIVNQIRDASPTGGFIKKNSLGEWYEVGTAMSREKVGHALRDCITEPLRQKTKATEMERRSSLKQAQDAILRTCLPQPNAASPPDSSTNTADADI